MITKALAGLGLAVLLASAPAHADGCNQSTRVYGDDNYVVNNCTIVRDPQPDVYPAPDYGPVGVPYPVMLPAPQQFYFVPGPQRWFAYGWGRYGGHRYR
jgi:hypothetical protein